MQNSTIKDKYIIELESEVKKLKLELLDTRSKCSSKVANLEM
jgi:hypothetical protein